MNKRDETNCKRDTVLQTESRLHGVAELPSCRSIFFPQQFHHSDVTIKSKLWCQCLFNTKNMHGLPCHSITTIKLCLVVIVVKPRATRRRSGQYVLLVADNNSSRNETWRNKMRVRKRIRSIEWRCQDIQWSDHLVFRSFSSGYYQRQEMLWNMQLASSFHPNQKLCRPSKYACITQGYKRRIQQHLGPTSLLAPAFHPASMI